MQVMRINERVDLVQRRSVLRSDNKDFGFCPVNEIETVLLFQKISLTAPRLLPGGLALTILDYSPRDIDAICRIQQTPAHPIEIGPVEFEYSLTSFFTHGHDYRQVKLIVCFTIAELIFPFRFGGITYDLIRAGGLPKLTNLADWSSVPCLVLEELFKK
jgi:hypothetical protein